MVAAAVTHDVMKIQLKVPLMSWIENSDDSHSERTKEYVSR